MSSIISFNKLGLARDLLSALSTLGYELPTPIQEQSIPVLLAGDDLLAQAQTGTGKTAAFALPILSQLDLSVKKPQALVIAPTRELAIQVAEAFRSYAKDLNGFQVTPIYGGQDYVPQLRALKRGAHVVVGTPGRLMDHLRRGSLLASDLKTLVLDEADEMLKMGFIDDIEWILEQIPNKHQTALFSATMPKEIQKIADRYLKQPKKIQLKPSKNTIEAIEQFYIRVAGHQKLEVLTRFLEVETVEASIIFTRTKNGSAELAEKLQARGYAAAPINGDMNQSAREKAISRLKNGSLDILVATDVAARGIDVDRVTHVINFDIPHDTESYIHRIGRTGRAGRTGKAFLFVAPRENRLLKDIEHAIDRSIKQIEAPTLIEMQAIRSKQLIEKVTGIIEKSKKLGPYREVIQQMLDHGDFSSHDVAAALAYLLDQANPLSTTELTSVGREYDEGNRSAHRRKERFKNKSSQQKRSPAKKREGKITKPSSVRKKPAKQKKNNKKNNSAL